jgi:membrane associated rhomboid family serine protease
VTDPAATEQDVETCYRHPDRPTYIHCQRCGRPICAQCQTQAAVGVQCPECVREGRAEVAAARGGAAGAVRRLVPGNVPIVTFVLMGLCVLVYLGQLLSGGLVTNAGVLDPSRIASEPWRLLTSAFLHSPFQGSPTSLLHIVFNMYALFIFGPPLERFLGRVRFLALYLIGALGGSIGVVLVYQLAVATNGASVNWLGGLLQPSSALGASGAIFALLGAMLVLHRAMGVRPFQLIVVVVANLAITFFVSGIAWEAHVGGFVVGLVLAVILLRTRRIDQKVPQIAGFVGVAVLLAVIVIVSVSTSPGAYV